jgi:hypothetical protein
MTARLLQKAVDKNMMLPTRCPELSSWEAGRHQFADNLLILLVGAQGLEPWTR